MQPSQLSFENYKHYKGQVLSLYKDISTLIKPEVNSTLYEYINKLIENLKKDEFIIDRCRRGKGWKIYLYK